MQTVIETASFLRDARAVGLTDEERAEIINFVALKPDAGKEIKGTGGARKLRFAGKGKAKVEVIGLSPSIVATTSLYFY